MSKDSVRLSPGRSFHLYNRSIGGFKVFSKKEHYQYFLERYQDLIIPVVHTYSYCLMPDHFHFLIRVKEEEVLDKVMEFDDFKRGDHAHYVSFQFSRLFNSYAKVINRENGRHGSVFTRPFKRKKVHRISYLRKLVHYIHKNPVAAGLCELPSEWPHSSFNDIRFGKDHIVDVEDVLDLFEGIENFHFVHRQEL
jgi:putative transposase